MAELSVRVGFALLCRKKSGVRLGGNDERYLSFRSKATGPLSPLRV